MGIRNDRYKAMVPTVTGALKLKGRVHGTEARFARAHTARKLKITMPGPMTIIDTIADKHYGDRVKMAFAFADLLNEEARALEADGVDVIQFDEPAFNVYMKEVSTWGIEALHRAIDGLKCTTAVHICYGYGIKANIDWKATLGGEWRQYEEIFPALAASRIDRGVGRVHRNSKVPIELLALLKGKDVQIGVIDVANDAVETPEEVAADHRGRAQARAEGAHRLRHQLRHGADAPRHRGGQAQRARPGRGAGAQAVRLGRSERCLRTPDRSLGAIAFDRAALLASCSAAIVLALAEHLLILGAIDHGVDDVAARTLAQPAPSVPRAPSGGGQNPGPRPGPAGNCGTGTCPATTQTLCPNWSLAEPAQPARAASSGNAASVRRVMHGSLGGFSSAFLGRFRCRHCVHRFHLRRPDGRLMVLA